MQYKKSICIISFSPIHRDARVLRQIKYLSPHYDLTVIGYGEPHPHWKDSQNVKWITLQRPKSTTATKLIDGISLLVLGRMRSSFYEFWYWKKSHHVCALETALSHRYDAIHANDWEALPLAAEIARRHDARLVLDLHEYAPLEFEDSFIWRLLFPRAIIYFLRKYACSISASTTVVPAIAERYNREFGISPVVVLNAPESIHLPSREIDPHNIKLIHHGAAIRSRRIEIMIEALALSDHRYSLHFMLIDNEPHYIQELKSLADKLAPERVIFHAPVPPEQITQRIAEYDIGFCLISPSNYNYLVSLPNKMFDFIVAGAAVCIGPSPAMVEMVRQYGFGCVANSFDARDVAEVLNGLTMEQLTTMRQAARQAAKQLNAETEMGKVVDLYERLLADGDH